MPPLDLDLKQRLPADCNVSHTCLLGQPCRRFLGQGRDRPTIVRFPMCSPWVMPSPCAADYGRSAGGSHSPHRVLTITFPPICRISRSSLFRRTQSFVLCASRRPKKCMNQFIPAPRRVWYSGSGQYNDIYCNKRQEEREAIYTKHPCRYYREELQYPQRMNSQIVRNQK